VAQAFLPAPAGAGRPLRTHLRQGRKVPARCPCGIRAPAGSISTASASRPPC